MQCLSEQFKSNSILYSQGYLEGTVDTVIAILFVILILYVLISFNRYIRNTYDYDRD